jgi:hypothetical protein
MKHSAANTIQSQWKKKKKPTEAQDKDEPKPKKGDIDDDNVKTKPQKMKKASGKAKTVPPPSEALLEWARGLTVKKSKRNVAAGMRVKVRFATNVRKANGKLARKLKWYGGLVTGVSTGGSKIRIKYDDGTSEVSKFPDKDIIVDDEGNGTHQVSPGKFIPPKDRAEKKLTAEQRADEQAEEEEKEHAEEKSIKKRPSKDEESEQDAETSVKKRPSVTKAEESEQAVASVHVKSEDNSDGATSDENMDISEKSESASTNQTDEPKIPPKPTLKIRLKPPKASREIGQGVKVPTSQSRSEDERHSDEDESHSDYGSDDEDVMSVEKEMNEEVAVEQEEEKEPDHASEPPRETTNSGDAVETLENVFARKNRAYDSTSADDESIDEPPKKKPFVESDVATLPTHEDKEMEQEISGTSDIMKDSEPEAASQGLEASWSNEAEENEGASPSPPERKRKRDEPASSNNSRASSKSPPPEAESPTPMSADLKESTLSNDDDDDLSKPVSSVAMSKKDYSDHEEEEAPNEKLTSSKNSAFDRKDKDSSADLSDGNQQANDTVMTDGKDAVDVRKLAVTPPPPQEVDSNADLPSAPVSVPRFGRRAAQEANQRIAARQEIVIQDTYSKTKKQRKEKSDLKLFSSAERKGKPRDDASDDEDDREWVQCDNCLKWRILPSNVQTSKLPKHWYCEMNVYDQFRNTCDAPEQTQQEIAKEKRRRKRKRAKIARLEAAGELDAETAAAQRAALTKEKRPKKERLSTRSPVPVTKGAQDNEAERDADNATEPKAKHTSPFSSEESAPVADSPHSDTGSDTQKSRSMKKQSSFNSASRKSRSDDVEEANNMEVDFDGESVPKVKVSRGRGRPRVNKEADKGKNDKGKSGDKDDPDNLEWVMCEKCSKWRRLPPHVSADSLPDVWYCTMNTWDRRSATCEADEDKADPTHREFGIYGSGVSTASYGNKLSYRNLIFGQKGRKQNRPVSERTRAAESLFLTPTDPSSEGVSYPKVMYSNSSVFMPRNNTASKANTSDNCAKPSLFDLMSRSNLWAELRGASIGKPDKVGISVSNSLFDDMSGEMKRTMKQLILHALGSGKLACHEVLLEAQCRPWSSVPQEWAEIRASCTVDIVEGALHGLVADGLVERVSNGAHGQVTSPKYRRVSPPTVTPVVSKEIKVTRCMKIAKPWKKARLNATREFCK